MKILTSHSLQMCEQAAEAHKSKGAGFSSRRSRMNSDPGQISKSSVDALLSSSSSVPSSQVCACLDGACVLSVFLLARFQNVPMPILRCS